MKGRPDPRQVSLLPPEAASILHLVRENLRLLADLVSRYELAPPTQGPAERSLRGPAEVAAYLAPELAELAQEQLRVVLLDSKNRVLAVCLVYQGGLNATVVRLADLFREAVRVGAATLILVHNHPSGDPSPSPEDIRLTREAGRAGDLLGIEVLDHVVVARQGHVSLREKGLYAPAARTVESVSSPVSNPSTGGDANA